MVFLWPFEAPAFLRRIAQGFCLFAAQARFHGGEDGGVVWLQALKEWGLLRRLPLGAVVRKVRGQSPTLAPDFPSAVRGSAPEESHRPPSREEFPIFSEFPDYV